MEQSRSIPLVELRSINQAYEVEHNSQAALKAVSLSIYEGDICAIVGKSGSGKTTLMNIIGLLDAPVSGEYYFQGANTRYMSADGLAHIRNTHIGFIFQSFNLIARLTALDNVALPLFYRGAPKHQARLRASNLLGRMGLSDKALNRPAQLSGGQQQRVAIARALVTDPALILADEPTGNLDPAAADEALSILFDLSQQSGVALVIVTHDVSIATRCDRHVEMTEGQLMENGAR